MKTRGWQPNKRCYNISNPVRDTVHAVSCKFPLIGWCSVKQVSHVCRSVTVKDAVRTEWVLSPFFGKSQIKTARSISWPLNFGTFKVRITERYHIFEQMRLRVRVSSCGKRRSVCSSMVEKKCSVTNLPCDFTIKLWYGRIFGYHTNSCQGTKVTTIPEWSYGFERRNDQISEAK